MGLKDAIGRVLGGIGEFENSARFGQGYRERADMLARVNDEELKIKALTANRLQQEADHADEIANAERFKRAFELAPILARVGQYRRPEFVGPTLDEAGLPNPSREGLVEKPDLSKFVPGLDPALASQIYAAGEDQANRADEDLAFNREIRMRTSEDDVARAQNYGQPTARDFAMWAEMAKRADRAAAGREAARNYLSPASEEKIIARLSGQWTKAAAPAATLANQVRLMETGLEAARKGDLAQGSQAVLVTFQKILDPNSVVRESEYNRSPSGLALDARLKGAFEKLTQGGAGVPYDELVKFADLARAAVRAQTSGYLQSQRRRISLTADRYGIPPELVFDDDHFGGDPTSDPAGPPTGPAASGGQVEEWVKDPTTGRLVRKNASPR